MAKVTDPALLAALEEAPQTVSGPKPGAITDPRILAALNGDGPSKVESGARGGLQGLSFGWGDEATGALAAILPFAAREELTPPKGQPAPKTLGERYRMARDYYRRRNAEAQEFNPNTYLAGEVGGAVIPAVVTMGGSSAVSAGSAARALPLAARAAQGARTGAALGAVGGAGASEADTALGVAGDAALGGATGVTVGAALPAVGAGLKRSAGWAADRLRNKSIETGRKALSGIGTSLAARKEIPEASVREALKSGSIKPFGTVQGTAARLASRADSLGAQYADILKKLEAAGVFGPEAEALARRISTEASNASTNSLGSTVPGFLSRRATELEQKALPIAGRGRLGLMQAEEMKRGLQREAQQEYNKLTQQSTALGDAKKQLAGMVREEIEQAVDQQASRAPAEAAAFRPVKEQLSNTLGALRPAEEGAARAARRKPVSLTSTIVGSAAGAASGNPGVGFLAAMGHGIADRRLASTGAWSAYQGQRLLEALQKRLSPAQIEALRRSLPSVAAAERPFSLQPALADGESQ